MPPPQLPPTPHTQLLDYRDLPPGPSTPPSPLYICCYLCMYPRSCCVYGLGRRYTVEYCVFVLELPPCYELGCTLNFEVDGLSLHK